MFKKYISVVEEERYFEEIYGQIVKNAESIFLTPNYLEKDEKEKDEKDNIKGQLDTMFRVDEEAIRKAANFDIASGGLLPMPERGESVNVRFICSPYRLSGGSGVYMTKVVIYGREDDLQYDFIITSQIYKGILSEMEKAKMPVDINLECIVNRVFTIAGREWTLAPRELWDIYEITKKPIAPKVYAVALRLDLERKMTKMGISQEEFDREESD